MRREYKRKAPVARPKVWRQRASAVCVTWILILVSSPPAKSIDWAMNSAVTLNETYSDNVSLSANNAQSEFVTDVTPGFVVQGTGPRVVTTLSAGLQAVIFPSGNFDNQFNPQVQGQGTGELIEELLFVDVDGSVSQTNANNTQRVAKDNLAQTGNRINEYTVRASPYLRHHFGDFAQSEIRYTYDEVINEGATVDSKANGARFQLDGGSRFSRLPWQVLLDLEKIEFDDGTAIEFGQAGGSLTYVIGRRFSVFAGSGYEFNKFDTAQGQEGGIFWEAGGDWTPSKRLSVQAGYRDRFFGGNFFFTVQHRTRRVLWKASYKEDVTVSGDVDLEFRATPLGDPFNLRQRDTGLAALGDTKGVTVNATPTSEVLVKKRFDGAVLFQGQRTSLNVRGVIEDRVFQKTGENEMVTGVSANASRRISGRTSVGLGGNWENTDFRGGLREDTRWANVNISHQIRGNMSGSLEYRHVEQDSSDPNSQFKENRFSAVLTVNF